MSELSHWTAEARRAGEIHNLEKRLRRYLSKVLLGRRSRFGRGGRRGGGGRRGNRAAPASGRWTTTVVPSCGVTMGTTWLIVDAHRTPVPIVEHDEENRSTLSTGEGGDGARTGKRMVVRRRTRRPRTRGRRSRDRAARCAAVVSFFEDKPSSSFPPTSFAKPPPPPPPSNRVVADPTIYIPSAKCAAKKYGATAAACPPR